MFKKGFPIIGIAFAVIVIIGGVLVWQLWPKDEFTDWQTYTNNKYGFELKYPNNYEISTKSQSNIGPDIVSSNPPVLISFIDHSPNMTIGSWEPIKINGENGFKSSVMGNMDGGSEYSVFFSKNGKALTILFSTKAPNTESELTIFNQILSTFKFIGVDETADWKTYQNEEYNISLKYPSNWALNWSYHEDNTRYEGEEGFFMISAMQGDEENNVESAYKLEAYHKLKPYGSSPKIESLRVSGQDARLILPSDDYLSEQKGQRQAALIVKYTKSIKISESEYGFFVLWADENHIKQIITTLRFLK